MANQNYTLGRGKLYFSLFKADTQEPAGYRYIGNTPEISLTISADNLDHFSSDAGIKEKDDSVPLSVDRTGAFTTDSIKPENIARFFFGENSQITVVGADVEDEPIVDVFFGGTYQLGQTAENPLGNRDVSAVTVGGNLATKASQALTFSGAGTAGDTVTIGTRTYTLAASAGAANTVAIGASAAATAFNLMQAINADDGAGLLYGAGTVAHAQVDATRSGAVVTVTAKTGGTAGNSIATTESGTSTSWGGATLAGGAASTGSIPADGNYTVDLDAGLITIDENPANILAGDDLTVSYTYAGGVRERILSGSEPVEGSLLYRANNPKGADFHYLMPWVKLTPNGDYSLKGDDWQAIPFNLEVLKSGDKAAIYVDGKEFVR